MARDLSVIGHALASPARSLMLNALMDGSRRPAGELAVIAGVSAATASEHLGVLLDAGLVDCDSRGRNRFYALADAGVAQALEHLGHLCPPAGEMVIPQSSRARQLAHARLCYDHLAGRLGVVLADALVRVDWVESELTAVTASGSAALAERGVDVDVLRAGRRPVVRPCADWTERRPHLAGAVGAAIAALFLQQEWVARTDGRGLRITAHGETALRERWGAEIPALPA